MRNPLIILVLFLFIPFLRAEEPQRSVEEEAQFHTERLSRDLGDLTCEQRSRVYALFLEISRERRESNTVAEDAERRVRILKTLETILNADQYHRFANRQIDPRPRRGGGEPHTPAPRKPVQ